MRRRCLPIMPTLGQIAATVGSIFAAGMAVVVGALFGVFTIFLLNPIYHWITGQWVDSVIYQLAASFWPALVLLAWFRARLREKSAKGESRFIPHLSVVVGEFSMASMLDFLRLWSHWVDRL